jgi:hypothetical protein
MSAAYSVTPRESGGFLVRFRSWVIGSADSEAGAWVLARSYAFARYLALGGGL